MAKIRTLFEHTFIYGLSSVAGKGINYLLMPIHTYSIIQYVKFFGMLYWLRYWHWLCFIPIRIYQRW